MMEKFKSYLLTLLLTTVLTFFVSTETQALTISEILNHPDKYHLSTVQVKGNVLDLKSKTSKRGNEYTMMVLSDEQEILQCLPLELQKLSLKIQLK